MAISHVELELAREPAHPFGDREHVCDLYLPILGDGRIDEERAKCCDGHCRFRCRRPGMCEARGAIRLQENNTLELEYGDASGSAKVKLPTTGAPFVPGQLLPIADDGGNVHMYQILFVRQE